MTQFQHADSEEETNQVILYFKKISCFIVFAKSVKHRSASCELEKAFCYQY